MNDTFDKRENQSGVLAERGEGEGAISTPKSSFWSLIWKKCEKEHLAGFDDREEYDDEREARGKIDLNEERIETRIQVTST